MIIKLKMHSPNLTYVNIACFSFLQNSYNLFCRESFFLHPSIKSLGATSVGTIR